MQSSKVDQFLSESGGNNFTESAPRPPVPGEENEKESNGGMSTQSSGSHKSQISHTSGRSMGSNKGEINPATPRKSNIDKVSLPNVSCAGQGYDDEMDAPLGFEPEGSAANSPPFTENSTPPYLKWAESLYTLLDDRDGVQLFRTFLVQEGIGTSALDFWYACRGLKMKVEDGKAQQVIKVIHKKFIKSEKLPYLDAETKRDILLKINSEWNSDWNLTIFNDAQAQVEEFMKKDTYPLFLKSDLYVQYVSNQGESPKSSNSSSGSNSARPLSSGPLPTLKEDQELQQDDLVALYIDMGPPPIKSVNRSLNCDTKRQEIFSSAYVRPVQLPYHVSYAPVSAQDSEIQSLSSQDALTDDTRSLTDSSVDGHSYREARRHKNYFKAMKKRAGANKEYGHNFIPRTERAPKDRNIAEYDCQKFAEELIEKLLAVQKEREKEEQIKLSLSRAMNRTDISETLEKSCVSTTSSKNNASTSLVPLLTSSFIDEENADSILEEHCSRIWERSAGQTPSRSPGRHSPRSKSPDRFHKPLSQNQPHSGASSMPGTLHSTAKPLHNKKRTEFYSMSSFDSGMGEDLNKCSVETHKHIHHHHHHHHNERGRKSKHKLEIQAQHHSMVCWGDGTPRPHSSSGTRQKTGSRTHSDACSNLDSGISMIESVGQPQVDMSLQDPSRTKVIQWILDNENMNRGTSSAYTDSDKTSSTYKRSHKSSALTPLPQPPHKQSGSKKGSSSSHMNRSASAESGSRQPWVPQGGVGMMPNQPIMQDPSMPPMPPPNTRVQLEEVNRRLYESDTAPPKSKSFTGISNKDRKPGMPLLHSAVQDCSGFAMASAKTVPPELDTSTDSKTDKRTSKRSSGSGNTSGCSNKISVGYYLFDEPIPYMTTIPQSSVTLGQFKQLMSKRGNFRYFVKTYSKDFDSDAVYEEFKEDHRILPEYDGKILVRVKRREDLDSSDKSNGSDKNYQL